MNANEINRKDLIKNITDNLPMLRVSLGITQEKIADKIGVSRSTIISIETKMRNDIEHISHFGTRVYKK